MLIDDQTFLSIFNKISGSKTNPVHWNFTGNFIDGATNDSIAIHNIVSETIISKYSTAVSDNRFICMQVFKSTYLKLLKVNRKLLQFQLIVTPNTFTGPSNRVGAGLIQTFDAYLTDNTSEAIETRSGQLTGTQQDDLGELVTIHVQLVEKGLNEFRLWDEGGVYVNVKMETLLRGLMGRPLQAFGKGMTKGFNVEIYPVDNDTIYYQRLIANGVHLVDIPGWLQDKWGVYSKGMGYYLSNSTWHISSLYDISRYDKEKTRLTIINVPVNEMIGNPQSYVIQDDEVYIFATGNTKHIDNSDRALDGSGTGFRSAIAGNILDHFTDSTLGNTTVPKGRNMVSVSYDERDSDITNIKPVDKLFSCNPWKDSSTAIKNMGNIVKVKHEYSNSSLFIPFMPVNFLYKYMGTPYSLKGILLEVISDTKTPMSSSLDQRYKTDCDLVIYIERATQ